jgi:hypothetical protein
VTAARGKKTKARIKSPAKKLPAKKSAGGKSAAKKSKAARLDALLDRELEETFPASDPLELTEPGGPRKSPAKRKKRRHA